MSGEYWLGVLTLPAIAAAGFTAFVAWLYGTEALRQRGITFAVRCRRHTERVADYTLRDDIWWERTFGPVFLGGWYREEPAYEAPTRARFNRWIGVGRPDGPCFIAFHSRDLGEVTA